MLPDEIAAERIKMTWTVLTPSVYTHGNGGELFELSFVLEPEKKI